MSPQRIPVWFRWQTRNDDGEYVNHSKVRDMWINPDAVATIERNDVGGSTIYLTCIQTSGSRYTHTRKLDSPDPPDMVAARLRGEDL